MMISTLACLFPKPIIPSQIYQTKYTKQAEAEVVPSSSSVQFKLKYDLVCKVKFRLTDQKFQFIFVESRNKLTQDW